MSKFFSPEYPFIYYPWGFIVFNLAAFLLGALIVGFTNQVMLWIFDEKYIRLMEKLPYQDKEWLVWLFVFIVGLIATISLAFN